MGTRLEVLGESLPIARWILSNLRDKSTGLDSFRKYMSLAGTLLAREVSKELDWRPKPVETPLGAKAVELELESQPLIIGILGASLHMLEGFNRVYPGAPLGLIAAKRVEDGGLRVEVKYERLPESWSGHAIVVDPMLATGLTIEEALRIAERIGSRRRIVASIISSVEGVERVKSMGLADAIYTLAVDPELDQNYFIVPGLGDAGDRSMGVEY